MLGRERARLLLTKEGKIAKRSRERVTLERNPFSPESNIPYGITEKRSVPSALTWAIAHKSHEVGVLTTTAAWSPGSLFLGAS